MDGPEVLVSHYASLAFYTRIAALTFVGAIVGAMAEHLKEGEIRSVVGVGILLVIAALAEFNRRYTYAYVAAVYAACHVGTVDDGKDSMAVSARWCSFRDLNDLTPDAVRVRMLLSWITYLPGIALGAYLLWQFPVLAVLLASIVLGWIVWLAFRPYPKMTGVSAPNTGPQADG